MISSLILAVGSALWFGLLTSISPCPLATNIAAISYVGRKINRPGHVLLAGLLYTLGRMVSYILIALALVKGLLSSSTISMFLQQNLNLALGPILLVVGLLLLDVIPWPWTGGGSSFFEKIQAKADRMGLWGAAILGMFFALTFCPVSAALFFGTLIPLAVKNQSAFLLPSVYGVGTALPVVVFSFILAFAANRLSRAFSVLTVIEKWMRRVTAVAFIAIGIYYCLVYIFKVI